jgi:hypothetical protein
MRTKQEYGPGYLEALQNFTARLNSEPPAESLEKTPDGRASTVVISHIEMTLDELFLGQWSTTNFTWSAIANEVQGAITLEVLHPVTGEKIIRQGAASVIITVDRVPDELKNDPHARNRWALSPENKKPNALDLSFPKLKAECLKNAAQSLGKIFGRDLNRSRKDHYKPFKIQSKELPPAMFEVIEQKIAEGLTPWEFNKTVEILGDLISPEQRTALESKLKTIKE